MPSRPTRRVISFSGDEAGFSLVEAIVAAGLMAGALASLGQMLAISVANNRSARAGSDATVLALQKMEQLRGLTWGVDVSGLPISDTRTDTAAPIEEPTGGTGLSLSPGNTLTSSTNGWVDYVDQSGNALGGGIEAPGGAVYVRRWAIEPLAASPSDTIVIRVLVRPIGGREGASRPSAARWPDEARLVSIKTRKAP
jgi:type II secretory pathway pseudopilin PulG